MDAEFFTGTVMHARLQAPRYRFSYRIFCLLVDIDRIDQAAAGLRLFSRNAFNLLSFHDADHLAMGEGRTLRGWVEQVLARKGIALEGGRVRLLCMPRVLGFVFNPMSVWYCAHRDGSLRAIVCEVRNTFGERHCYVLHEEGGGPMDWQQVRRHAKHFHVSPFIGMEGAYRFRFSRPGQHLGISIVEEDRGERLLVATQSMERVAMTDTQLVLSVLAVPLMTLKVVLAIHWQALKIWLRGARFYRKPSPPTQEVS